MLAERVRKIGGTTIRSISHVSEFQTIADDNDDYVSADVMVQRLCDDNRRMVESLRKAHEACDEAGDVATTSILEVLIDETERRTWFLFETSQDEHE